MRVRNTVIKTKDRNELIIKLILWATIFILLVLEFYSIRINSRYKYDFIFLMILLIGVYFFKNKIMLHSSHFFLLSVFLILHNLGVFGFYSNFYLGMEYDFWVHSFFGFLASLMLFRIYKMVGPYRGWFMYIAIIAIVLGFSAFHELFEYTGAITLGKGEGVLFIGAGDLDQWDTQKDMLNNLIGALIGLSLYRIKNFLKK